MGAAIPPRPTPTARILHRRAGTFQLDPLRIGCPLFIELPIAPPPHPTPPHLPSAYRRADTFQLGPLRIARPLFMELPMAGLVTGVPDGGRVVGIVG